MNNEQNLDNPQNKQLNTADVIARFSNEHGWISYGLKSKKAHVFQPLDEF